MCKFLYVRGAVVLCCVCLNVQNGRECIFVHNSPQHLLSLPHNGRVSGEFYHRAWLVGGLRGRGPAQRAPMMLKR